MEKKLNMREGGVQKNHMYTEKVYHFELGWACTNIFRLLRGSMKIFTLSPSLSACKINRSTMYENGFIFSAEMLVYAF